MTHPVKPSFPAGLLALFAMLVALLCLMLAAGGCAAGGGVDPARVAEARASLDAVVAKIAEVDAEIAKLPPSDPVRAEYEAHRGKLDAARGIAEGLLASAEKGEVDPSLTAALSVIPGVGTYAALVVMGVTWIWTLAKKRKKEQQLAAADADLRKIVASVDAAFPQRTAEQKAALAKVQGPAVSFRVDELRSPKR